MLDVLRDQLRSHEYIRVTLRCLVIGILNHNQLQVKVVGFLLHVDLVDFGFREGTDRNSRLQTGCRPAAHLQVELKILGLIVNRHGNVVNE